jgi:hypothetical protein
MSEIAVRLARLAEARQLTVERMAFVRSLIHMHVVRMLGVRASAHEFVIYDHLGRQYSTEMALARRGAGGRRQREGGRAEDR